MKKIGVLIMAAVMSVGIVACGSNTNETENSAVALAVPTVKDGVMRTGDDCVESYFEWDAVEGADGYEVSVQNKFYSDADFSEAEIVETTDTFYVASAQDYFDFQIQVRAYKGTGDNKTYSDWSDYACGFTYEDSEVFGEDESADDSWAGLLTEDEAVEAIKKYLFEKDPNLEEMVNSDEYTIYWEVSSNDTQIIVLYRSYTGAEVRYYIDPNSGDTYVTEFVSGVTDEEEYTDETLNIWDYVER